MVGRSNPFLTAAEFETACRALAEASQACGSPIFAATVDRLEDVTVLRVAHTTSLVAKVQDGGEAEEALDVHEDVDEAQVILCEPSMSRNIMVEYSIALSPTYSVPVLYFRIIGQPSNSIRDLNRISEQLIPSLTRPAINKVGVMGAVSFANDPITDVPCFFVHPCRTADALRDVLLAEEVSPLRYLLMWLGLVGPVVNLHLPRELAMMFK